MSVTCILYDFILMYQFFLLLISNTSNSFHIVQMIIRYECMAEYSAE